MAAKAKLRDLCEAIVDCPHSTPSWTNEGVVVLRNQNIRNGRLDLSDPSFTDEQHYVERTKRAVPRAGDLVITREAPMGEVCIIPPGLRCCLGQRMVLLRPNPAKSDPRYLLYALQSKDVQHEIRVNEGTGSTVSNLRIPLLEALPVPSPPLEEQRAIAHILGTLDDKIELNRRMNETLEAMARALFKSWFVDFDPVRAKAANGPSLARGPHLDPIGEAERRAGQEVPMSDERHGGRDSRPTDPGLPKPLADLFPDSFEDSELGEIPKDWVMRPIYDIADVIYGAPFASSQFNTNGIGKPLIRIRDLVDEAPGVWTPEQHPKGYMVKPGDIAHVEATETATTVIHLGKGDIDRFSAVVPSPDVLAAFNRLCQPWYDRIVEVKHESRTLAALRDALLPKLISGEITASRLSNGNDNRRCG